MANVRAHEHISAVNIVSPTADPTTSTGQEKSPESKNPGQESDFKNISIIFHVK